jgi:hypothetical protein
MALSTGGGQKQKYKGIFINKAIVASVKDISHTTPSGWTAPCDLGIEVTVTVPRNGKEAFTKTIRIAGNTKMVGLELTPGSAFKVLDFFKFMGIINEDLTPSNDIPAEWLARVVGKDCYTLDFLAAISTKDPSKGVYFSYDRIDSDELFLYNDFMKQYTKGFVKKFMPDILDANGGGADAGDAFEPEGALAPAEEIVF